MDSTRAFHAYHCIKNGALFLLRSFANGPRGISFGIQTGPSIFVYLSHTAHFIFSLGFVSPNECVTHVKVCSTTNGTSLLLFRSDYLRNTRTLDRSKLLPVAGDDKPQLRNLQVQKVTTSKGVYDIIANSMMRAITCTFFLL